MLALASLFTIKLAIPTLAHGGPEPPRPARVLDIRHTPLALPEGSGLHGRLTNREGAPLAGWVVEARRPWTEATESKVRSDKNGRYAFGSLAAGPLMLTLSPDRAGAPTGPQPVALFREGEADNRAAARRLDIGGLDNRGLGAWHPAAKPRPLGAMIVSLPAACHAMTGGSGLLVHDRQRAWRIDEEGRVGTAMAIAIGQELVAAAPAGRDGSDTVLLTQDAWHASLSCRDPRNQLRCSRQVPGRSLLLAPGEEGRFWGQTLDGRDHVTHVLDRNGNSPMAVQLPAHATAAGFAAADGIRVPAGSVRLVAAGSRAGRWTCRHRSSGCCRPARAVAGP
jgi:hypothetical protein